MRQRRYRDEAAEATPQIVAPDGRLEFGPGAVAQQPRRADRRNVATIKTVLEKWQRCSSGAVVVEDVRGG